MINMENKYYSIKEISKLLKVSYLTIFRLVKENKIVAYKVGKQYRIKESDFNNYLLTIKNSNNI
ncbi:hypothetical protein COY87_00025 [Candidatus Roizmanbacteria bacterium CG_4_10_14_0_8_um_filter_33_9]|uniref:Helix-turn-helix domain-containing protein n=1 Tax=Candidatus Roizmanbacteria bacterium CG_4_10_14_0_8_um_filter_33_9 TaxID=1974826 RepID=A0A2M7QKT1_9BACT|nr:MAG: hypothetical protein COY87_00025 [Candidatus Roizmanbacteria bacterium CG_4_10_14_0_8_um_filter_33_9]